MIPTVLIWCYIAALTLLLGLIADALIARFAAPRESAPPALWLTAMLGGSTLGVLLTLLTLAMPIAALSHLIVLAVVCLGLTLFHRSIRTDLRAWRKGSRLPVGAACAGVALSIVLVLGFSVSSPDHYDSGLYHAQSIRWIDEYRAVPGLANLHTRFGFNSTWHILESFFGFSFLDPSGFRALNGLLLVGVTSMSVVSLIAVLRGDVRPGQVMCAMLLLPAIYYFQRFISSPVTDTPAALIGWLIWVAVIRLLERKDRSARGREAAAMVLVACFLVTVKLSAAPVLLAALVALVCTRGWSSVSAARLALGAGIVLVPWLVRSVVLSGALTFPASAMRPFPLDWAVPYDLIVNEEMWTRGWARMPGPNAPDSMALSPAQWIPPWWAALTDDARAMLALLILGPMVAALLLPRTWHLVTATIPFPRTYLALLVAGYLGVLFWFVNAPDFRFGLVSVIPLVILLVMPLVIGLHWWAPLPVRGTLVLLLLAQPLNTLSASVALLARPDRLVSPAEYNRADTRLVLFNGFPLLIPRTRDQCWNSPLPCAPSPQAGLILRGCTLQDGFRISAAPEQDRRTDCGSSRAPGIVSRPRIERVIMRRRGEQTEDIDCVADRQNEVRVLASNRGASATDLVVEIIFNDSLFERREIPMLGTDEERWIETEDTLRARRGGHVLVVRVITSGVDDERRIELRCA